MKSATSGRSLSLSVLLCVSAATFSQAEVVNFDDIDLQGEMTLPEPGVIGSNGDYYFANFGCFDSVLVDEYFGYSGYSVGAVSGVQAAYQIWAAPASIVGTNYNFDAIGGWFTAGWREGLTLHVRGFRGNSNTQVYEETFELSTTESTYLTMDFLDVSILTFETTGGTYAGHALDGANFIMDDIELFAVPSPAGFFLLLPGLAASRRRRV